MKTNSKTNAQVDYEHHESPSFDSVSNGGKFAERIRVNRQKLCSEEKLETRSAPALAAMKWLAEQKRSHNADLF